MRAVDALLPFPGPGAACGDVASAHAWAETLLSAAGRRTGARRLARTFLTAALLEACGQLEAPTFGDVRRLILLMGRPGERPFRDSAMQFLQFVDADSADLDPDCRQSAIELCLWALRLWRPENI